MNGGAGYARLSSNRQKPRGNDGALTHFEDMLGEMGGIEKCEAMTGLDDRENPKTFLGHFFRNMGGASFIMGATEIVLSNAGKLLPENKKYQTAVKIARGVIPAATMGYKVYRALKDAAESTKPEEETPYERRRRAVRNIMGIPEIIDGEKAYISDYDLPLGQVVVSWLEALPETETLRVLSIHPEDEPEKRETSLGFHDSFVKIAIQDLGEIVVSMRASSLVARKSVEVFARRELTNVAIFEAIIKAFLESCNVKETVFHMKSFELSNEPRPSMKFTPMQLTDEIVQEMRHCITRERRRTYAMIGEPGCGKSTVALKLQDIFREVPVIVVNVAEISEARDITPAYFLAASVAPAIVILEDIDQLDLKHKTSHCLGTLIELLDSTKMLNAVVTVMTLNEPQKVHPSLMDRRGRIDRILRFGPPSHREEAKEVLEVWTDNLFETELPVVDESFYDEILRDKLNHADIKELVEQCKIREDCVTEVALRDALDRLRQSKSDLQKFIEMQRNGRGDELKDFLGTVAEKI